MTRILGAFVKSAVNTAAITQVANADMVPLHGCITTWSGKTAFAAWRVNPAGRVDRSRLYRDDGSRRKAVKFRINYPAMPDDALLTRREADLIAAFTLHETGHVIYTNNRTEALYLVANLTNPLPRLHMLANGFEDARMEATVIKLGARNARNQFQQLLGKLTGDIGRSFNPCNLADSPFTVALLGRDALGNGNTYTSQLLSRIPEPQRSIYAAAVEWFAKAPIGYDEEFWSYKMADRFLQLWDAMRKAEQKDQPEQPEQPDAPEPQDAEQDDAEQDQQDGQPEPQDDGEEFGDDGDDGDEEGGAPPPYELDDESDDQQDAEPEGDDADDGKDADAETDSPEDVEQEKDDGKPFDGSAPDGAEFNSPEPSIDDVIKRINKRTDSDLDIKMSAFSPAERTTDIMDYLNRRS